MGKLTKPQKLALEWLKATGYEDPVLAKLASQLTNDKK